MSLLEYPKGEISSDIIKSKFYERINEYYLNTRRFYTDGSKNDNGVGCAVATENDNGMSLRLHDECTVYSAEL